jgi:sulfur carrier protein ThiS
MRITVKLYATLANYLPPEAAGTNAMQMDLAEGAKVAEVIERLNLPAKLCHLVLIDGTFVPPSERAGRSLAEGETLALWPPIAGG